MVAQGHGPTGEAGASVSLDYRLDLGWDVPATGPVALEIQFTASPGVDLYASHVYPNPFRLDRGEEVTIGFYLPGQGLQSVTLTITTLASQPVYSTSQVLAGGQWQTMTWNGQGRQDGWEVGAGQYRFEVKVGEQMVAAGTVVAEYPHTGSNSVFGVVRDYETKEPLSGAVVKLYNSNFRLCASMTTDATGQYDFSWLSSDMYFLVASRPAYYPHRD